MPPIPSLSLELETWLQSHDDRRRQWEEQMKDDSLRMCCILHEESVRLVLTELSPYGTCLFSFLSITDGSISEK